MLTLRRPTLPRVRVPQSRLAVGLFCAGAVAMTALGAAAQPDHVANAATTKTKNVAATSRDADRTARASRADARTAPVVAAPAAPAPAKPAAPAAPAPAAPAPAAPVPAPAAAKPVTEAVVPGLDRDQAINAAIIVAVGRSMGAGARGETIAVATSLQESELHNLDVAVDHDSLGLFQQRPSSGWGSPTEILSPWHAAQSFYAGLLTSRADWACLTCAAQRVQVSAYPDAYAKHETQAAAIVATLGG